MRTHNSVLLRCIKLSIVAALIIGALTGCYDAREIDDVVHITILGIDKGVSNSWRLTVQFSSQKEGGDSSGGGGSSSGGSSGGEEEHSVDGYSIISLDAPSLTEGLDMLNVSMQRQADFSQTHVIAISEELASEGIRDYVSQIINHPEIRRSIYLFVVKGTAYDFVRANKPFVGSSIIKNYRIWVDQSSNTGYFPYVTLGDFYENMKSRNSQSIATIAAINDFSAFEKDSEEKTDKSKPGGAHMAGEIPRVSDNKIDIWGTAIFNSDSMIAELDGDETRFLLMIRDEFSGGNLSVPHQENPGKVISMRLEKARATEVDVDTSEDIPHIHVSVTLEGSLSSELSSIDFEQESHRTDLEKNCSEYIEVRLEQLVEKCRSLNTDPFGFGKKAKKNFLTIDEMLEYDWNNKFKDSVVKVDVTLSLKHVRRSVDNLTIIY